MSETRYFFHLVTARVNSPLPEPLRSEVIEHFYYEDYGRDEWNKLHDKRIPSWKEIFANTSLDDDKILKPLSYKDRKRYEELSLLRERYKSYETEDDGYDDESIQQCVRYARDEVFFKLNEHQREIAIELLELKLLRLKWYEENEPWTARFMRKHLPLTHLEIILDEEERRLKYRYLYQKYGRRERLKREAMREKNKRERERKCRIAACLG